MAFFGNKRKDFSIQPPRQQVDGTPFFVTDSANIDFTLANLNLTANLTQLLPTSGTYGSSTLIPILEIDQFGRITGVTTTTFSASGILLQTNDVDNIVQTILNLKSGTDITVTDNGDGSVSFDYTGTPTTYTVNNGLSPQTTPSANPNNFQLGGALTKMTTITASGGNRLNITSTNTTPLYVTTTGAAQNAINCQSVNGDAGSFYSTNASALVCLTDSGSYSGSYRSNSNLIDNAVIPILDILAFANVVNTLNGFGASIDFRLMTDLSIFQNANKLISKWSTANNATRTSQFEITTVNNAVESTALTLKGTGQLQLNKYTAPFSGTAAYALGVDASGNVITTSGGTGTVTGVTATSPITSSGGTAPVISTSMATNKLIGRGTAGAGVMEEITLGTGLSLSGTTLNATASSGGILHGTAAGTDTYTVTITGATTYADGDAYLIRFTNGNTTSATLNINDGTSFLGAKDLYRNNDGLLLGGDIINGGEMLCVYNPALGGAGGFQLIGTSPNSLISYVTNADSVTITKGQVVYAFGGVGDRMTVKLANNSGDATSAQTVGLVLSTSIATNQKGLIMMQGLLDGLDTVKPVNGWLDGDPVYLGDTAGSITRVKPYAPKHLVYLGVVTTANPGSAGRMYVRIQNGYELDELHNVQARTPALKDTLWYDNTVSPAQWKTASIATILGYTPLSQTLANTNIFVGNISNVATGVAMTGDAAISNAGVLSLNTSFTAGSFGVTFDGGGALITSGKIGYVRVPYKGTITGWQLVADQSGSCSIAVKQGLFSPFPPTTTILTAALSGTQTSSGTGLSLAVTAGDWFSFTITGTSAVQLVNLSISITKII